ncbi:CBM9 family sugar-binding protein [Shewanella gaetbuli]|uniref:CBM9 family sugar-binding protein n=1 Tax=Shewanella gaetbuli TaxID=220752 RepID=A0A9X2CKQ3_9GAMM|nr:CBM9 family sugar-binding protein [Shewanella gaetbuli]MCL1141859.1 CBM9 family sugar-binding protein [Shewanella gaetbuli]
MKHTLIKLSFCSSLLFCSLLFCAGINADIKPQPTLPLEVGLAKSAINIDGKVDAVWQRATWQPLDKLILGEQPSAQDFSGRYKLLWRDNQLFLLAEIIDDVLLDKTADPKVAYWDDDCLEIFIDPDASGGEHQANHNAFAYHVALDNQVADYGLQNEAILLNDHVKSRWMRDQQQPNIIYWEAAITLYPQSYNDLLAANHKDQALPLALNSGDIIGFMLAYCDNDGSAERESFIGSHEITPINGDKNLGYKNADVFGKIKLVN